jgi:hypothetical protein
MKIQLERTGGFAGIPLRTNVDTDNLDDQSKRTLQSLVDSSRFFDLPARLSSPTPGADRFQFKVTIQDGNRSHTVEADEGALAPEVQALFQYLTRLARMNR